MLGGDDDKRRNLQLGALTVEKLLSHFPKNKYCAACQRARLRRRPIGTARQDKGDKAVEFGDVITCDHIIASKDEAEGLISDTTALTIYDLGTHFTGCYPLKTKTSDDARRALQHFRGPRAYFRYVYSDNSGEIWKAVDELGFLQGTSTPGVHETNAHIERRNETILGGTRTVLENAGLPSCFWPLASSYFCHMLNIKMIDGDSSWNRRHKSGHLAGARIPFGCAVDFIPNNTKKKWKTRNKWTSNSIPGIFMGYKLLSGHVWNGEFYAAAIEDIKDFDLSVKAKGLDSKLSLHTVREIVVDNLKGYIFPLKAKYDATNRSVEGAVDSDLDLGDTWDVPPTDLQDTPSNVVPLQGVTAENAAEAPMDEDIDYEVAKVEKSKGALMEEPRVNDLVGLSGSASSGLTRAGEDASSGLTGAGVVPPYGSGVVPAWRLELESRGASSGLTRAGDGASAGSVAYTHLTRPTGYSWSVAVVAAAAENTV